jgi:hypothetical protein
VFHLDKELQQHQWRKRHNRSPSDFMIEFFCNSIRNFTASLITSGPIPSPANSACISFFIGFFLPLVLPKEMGDRVLMDWVVVRFYFILRRFSLIIFREKV